MLAVTSFNGNASTHLVNKSVITRMYLFPCEEVGRGPIISQDSFSKGLNELIVPNGAGGFGCGGLHLWHWSHCFIQDSTARSYPGQ